MERGGNGGEGVDKEGNKGQIIRRGEGGGGGRGR